VASRAPTRAPSRPDVALADPRAGPA